jgi:dolichol-phosphate mannosyltransferase
MKKNSQHGSGSTLVLVAALNEEAGIGLTLEEIKKFVNVSRILVVDGNSKDQTVNVAKSYGADVILQDGVGKGNAIYNALQKIDEYFDYIVLTDADFTYPAKYISDMINILNEDPRVGMVCGNRFNAHLKIKAMRNILYFGNRFISFTHNILNGVTLQDPLTGLRVIRGSIFSEWEPKSEGFDIEVELNHFVEKKGYKIVEIEIPYRQRIGEKKLKLKDGLVILKRIMIERFS